MSLFMCHRPLYPPSGVTHVKAARLTGGHRDGHDSDRRHHQDGGGDRSDDDGAQLSDGDDLVIVRGASLLEIHTFAAHDEDDDDDEDDDEEEEEEEDDDDDDGAAAPPRRRAKARGGSPLALTLAASFALDGTLDDLHVVPRRGALLAGGDGGGGGGAPQRGDALLLSFGLAKVSWTRHALVVVMKRRRAIYRIRSGRPCCCIAICSRHQSRGHRDATLSSSRGCDTKRDARPRSVYVSRTFFLSSNAWRDTCDV